MLQQASLNHYMILLVVLYGSQLRVKSWRRNLDMRHRK